MLQLHAEGVVHVCSATTQDDSSARRIGLDDRQTVPFRKARDGAQVGGVSAILGSELLTAERRIAAREPLVD